VHPLLCRLILLGFEKRYHLPRVEACVHRRDFIRAAVGSAAAWPLASGAQQPAMPVVGYLGAETPERFGIRLTAFRQGLSEMGYEEGRNVIIEYRWANGQNDRLPELAADLVNRKVVVIAVPGSGVAALAAKAATNTIPIVFETGWDPVAAGLVKTLNRPEGNVTGISSLNLDVTPKGLELLHELTPQSKSLAVFVNPSNRLSSTMATKDLEGLSRTLGLRLHILNVSTDPEIESAFAKLAQLQVGGLIFASDIFFNSRAQQLAALTLKHAVPAVHSVREFAASGGLMSYGGNIKDTHRQAGIYTGRILKGEKPADLPVQQATKVELYINLKTAKALGVTVPLPLSGRADELFE
jgi:putative tryptophan/tyrosine transport system substrate-binding protein